MFNNNYNMGNNTLATVNNIKDLAGILTQKYFSINILFTKKRNKIKRNTFSSTNYITIHYFVHHLWHILIVMLLVLLIVLLIVMFMLIVMSL